MVEKTPPYPPNRSWPETQSGALLPVEQPRFDDCPERSPHPFVHGKLEPALRSIEETARQRGAALPAEQSLLADGEVAVIVAQARQAAGEHRIDEWHAHLQ